jgi:hypothetical protein
MFAQNNCNIGELVLGESGRSLFIAKAEFFG